MNYKLLFVDDEPNILEAMKRQLRGKYSITTATGGEEALQVLKSDPEVVIIVADMRMPGMTGVELLSKVRSSYPNVVRMMLTGNADRQTAQDAVEKGAVFHFLTKPCEADSLITAIEAGLQLHQLGLQIKDIKGHRGAA